MRFPDSIKLAARIKERGFKTSLRSRKPPFVTPAQAGAQAKNQTISLGSRLRGNDGGGGCAVGVGTVGRRRRLVAVIDQPPVVRRILAHLGLATEVLTKPEESIWRVSGPPVEMFPPDLDDARLPVEVDGVDDESGEPFFDEVPADEWAA